MMQFRWKKTVALAALAVGVGAGQAGACGFLVAANGAVRLLRTSTLVAWEAGVEHYVTSFAFESDQESVGSIVPLPAEPTTVERAGDWTLQRLQREVQSENKSALAGSPTASVAESAATVLRQVQIDSLDVTVLKGGGKEVFRWAKDNGFDIEADVSAMLERYGNRSPYFMAAKFNANRAKASNFRSGDGIPVHLEIPLDRPWVPLQILGGAKDDKEIVNADVFLLTPAKPTFGSFDQGVAVKQSRPATKLLLDDLRKDKNSTWVPEHAYFTHVAINTPAGKLKRDLVPQISPIPTPPLAAATAPTPEVPWAIATGLGGLIVGALLASRTRRPSVGLT